MILSSNSIGNWRGDTGIERFILAECIGGVSSLDVFAGGLSSDESVDCGTQYDVCDVPGDCGAGVACLDRMGDWLSGEAVLILSRCLIGVAEDPVDGDPSWLGGLKSKYSSSCGPRDPVLN